MIWAGDRRSLHGTLNDQPAREALDALVSLGLPHDKDAFDIAEVINFATLSGLRGAHSFWRDFEVETGRRLARGLAGARRDGVPTLHDFEPRRFTVSFERAFAQHTAGSRHIRRVRLPVPVTDDQLSVLVVETRSAGARLLSDRIEFPCPRRDAARIEIRADYRFLADAGRPSGGFLPAGHPWLAPREGEIQVTDRVVALARDLASGLSPEQAVEAFRIYLLDELCCGYVHHDRIGAVAAPDWVLGNGWFDCRLGAALMASMCRACDIPARLVGGYLLWDSPAEHFWLEAWLPGRGWTPYDLLAWGLSAGGRDKAWRDIYAGWTDYRMKTQVFPHIFTGVAAAGLPRSCHRVHRKVPGGTEIRTLDARSGREIYRDTIRVKG
jgi:hypothetical protein